jgi:hypothetical protein
MTRHRPVRCQASALLVVVSRRHVGEQPTEDSWYTQTLASPEVSS